MSSSAILVTFLQSSVVLAVALVAGFLTRGAPALRLAIGRVALLCVVGLGIAAPWIGQRPAPIVPVEWNAMPFAGSAPFTGSTQGSRAISDSSKPVVHAPGGGPVVVTAPPETHFSM